MSHLNTWSKYLHINDCSLMMRRSFLWLVLGCCLMATPLTAAPERQSSLIERGFYYFGGTFGTFLTAHVFVRHLAPLRSNGFPPKAMIGMAVAYLYAMPFVGMVSWQFAFKKARGVVYRD